MGQCFLTHGGLCTALPYKQKFLERGTLLRDWDRPAKQKTTFSLPVTQMTSRGHLSSQYWRDSSLIRGGRPPLSSTVGECWHRGLSNLIVPLQEIPVRYFRPSSSHASAFLKLLGRSLRPPLRSFEFHQAGLSSSRSYVLQFWGSLSLNSYITAPGDRASLWTGP